MKLTVEIDITPVEFKELMIPSENQAKLWSDVSSQLAEAIQEQIAKNYTNMAGAYFMTLQKSQEKFFNNFNKK